MVEPIVAELTNSEQIATLAAELSAWEPRLELLYGNDESLIYEPDGTFYGICLSEQSALTVRHKIREISRGDAFVVPIAVSIDVDPPIRYLAIRHDGTIPNHFRERFIQTWGLDTRLASAAETNGGAINVLPDEPLRYRFRYQVLELDQGSFEFQAGFGLHLVIAFDEAVSLAQSETRTALGADHLVLIRPHTRYSVSGKGRAGVLVLETEVEYETRRFNVLAGRDDRVSPEFLPGAPPQPEN